MSGSVGRTIGATFYNAHAGAVRSALTGCMIADYPAALGVLGPGGVAATIAGMGAFIASKAGSLTLKLVHDYLNKNGVQVKNPLGTEWRTVGDANLASSPVTQQQGSLAAQASREGVEKAVREGDLSNADRDKPLQYVPSEAKFASGSYQPISAFCADATIFDAILSATMLSPDPNANELWKMIKGNVGPMIALKIKQKQLEAADLAKRAGRTVAHGAQVAGQGIVHGAQVTGQAVVRGAQAVGDATVRGAQAVGDATVRGAQAVGRGAVAVGQGIERGAEAVGDGVVRGAEATGRGIRTAANWVSSLFD
jgi:hypothetical protein